MGWPGRTLVVLTPLVLLTALGGWLLATPSGLTGALTLTGGLLPGELTWQSTRGRLLGPLAVEGLHYRDQGRQLAVGHLAVDWSPPALARGVLRLENLEVRDLELVLPRDTTDADQPFSLPQLQLPLALELWQADLENLKFNDWALERVRLTAVSRQEGIELDTLTVTGSHLELVARGRMTPRGDYPLDLTVDWTWAAGPGDLAGRGRLTGDLGRELRLDHRLAGALAGELDLGIVTPLTRPRWSGGLTLRGSNLGAFSPALADTALEGRLQSWGSPADHHLEGNLSTTLASGQEVTVTATANGDREQLTLKAALAVAEPAARLDTRAILAYPTLDFTLRSHWQRPLNWVHGGQRFTSGGGRFTLTGRLTDLW